MAFSLGTGGLDNGQVLREVSCPSTFFTLTMIVRKYAEMCDDDERQGNAEDRY